MALTIGIFEKEEEVLRAIRLLREAGADQDEIRVVVGNSENAPILASRTDIRLEEIYAIQEARKRGEDADLPLGVAPIATGYPVGNTTIGTGPAGVVLAGIDSGDDSGSEEVLQAIGIPGKAAEQCGKAVESGHYLLIADVDSEINTRSLLSHAGAANVVN